MGSKGEEEEDAPRIKRVPGWNGFTFRCYDATNVRERERERERERIRKALNIFNIKR